jgi:hypothetical protein
MLVFTWNFARIPYAGVLTPPLSYVSYGNEALTVTCSSEHEALVELDKIYPQIPPFVPFAERFSTVADPKEM